MANLIGQNLGPYRILEQIGMGGMATVYKAYQPSMDRNIAVKVLPPHFMQDPTFVERFEREARTIARLEHPHILPVYDYGKTDTGTTYIAMRYIEAGALSDILKVKTLSLDEAVKMFDQIANALGYAHEQGVIHRDMKPSNVLVDPRGQTFLTDFGLARMIQGSSQLTGSMIIGTPTYMAPEQGEGQPADARSDIYALGIILYEMVTGRPPFEAETPLAVMLKHITDPLPLPRDLNPNISESVERVILKALAKNPDDRYQSVKEFTTALHQARTSAPTVASPVRAASPPKRKSGGEETKPSKRKLPWLWIAIGSIVALVICGALAAAFGFFEEDTGSEQADAANQAAAATAPSTTEAPSPTAETPSETNSNQPVAPTKEAETVGPPPPGWTHFTNSGEIRDILAQGDTIWAGTNGGLVAWDRYAEKYEKLTTLNGLYYHNISSLLLDSEYNLWAGTGPGDGRGVLRFDGSLWEMYDEEDGLSSNTISFLSQSAGTIIAGTNYNGYLPNSFDGLRWQPTDLPRWPVDEPQVNAFFRSDNGETVVGLGDGGGLLYYPGEGDEWVRLTEANGLPSNSIVDVGFIPDESLIIVTGEPGGVGLFNGGVFTAVQRLGDVVGSAIYMDWEKKSIWLGTDNGGLYQFEDRPIAHYNQNDGLPEGRIEKIIKDDDGNLWLSMQSVGLVKFDGAEFTIFAVENEPAFHNARQILEVDDEIWFVHQWGDERIVTYNPNENTWNSFETPGSTQAVAFDSEGNTWYGTDEGLWRVTPKGAEQRFTIDDGLPGDDITSLAYDAANNSLWIGTTTGLAYHEIDNEDDPWRDFTEFIPGPYVETLYADRYDSIWIGTQRDDEHPAGAARAEEGTIYETWTAGDAFPEEVEAVDSFALDAEDVLWMGTWSGGLWYLDDINDSNWKFADPADGAPDSDVATIIPQAGGSVWFGTRYGGLWGFHPGEGWRQINSEDGLPGQAVSAAYIDSNGYLWVSTESGIGRFVEE